MMRLKGYMLTFGALLLALVTFGASKKREGRKDAENEFERDKAKRIDAGRKAVSDGRASGLSPADRVRRNDGDWGGV